MPPPRPSPSPAVSAGVPPRAHLPRVAAQGFARLGEGRVVVRVQRRAYSPCRGDRVDLSGPVGHDEELAGVLAIGAGGDIHALGVGAEVSRRTDGPSAVDRVDTTGRAHV